MAFEVVTIESIRELLLLFVNYFSPGRNAVDCRIGVAQSETPLAANSMEFQQRSKLFAVRRTKILVVSHQFTAYNFLKYPRLKLVFDYIEKDSKWKRE